MYVNRTTGWVGVMVAVAMAGGSSAWAQATNIGPGRVFCSSATTCELDIGSPASLRYKIDPAALPAADKDRLTKHCSPKGTPCIATVTGEEVKSVVKATAIKFYN